MSRTQGRHRTSGPAADAKSSAPFAITDPAFIPRERYFDRDFFELEKERLWPHAWQMACRLEEIPEVGDYVEYWVADYSVLVVRTSADTVKAYQNACRHRATQLAVGTGTFRGGQITCPFHGWQWNLDGSPSHLYGAESFEPRCMKPDDLRLIECQVDTWANCVFINMDPGAPPLAQALDPMPRLLDPLNVGKMHVYWWKAVRLRANWKMALEAFMEGWHVMQTHPELTMGSGRSFPADHMTYHSHPNGHSHGQQAPDSDALLAGSLNAGLSESEAIIEFSRTFSEGLDAMVLAKDVQILEGLRGAEHEPGKFQEKFMEALYAWNRGAGVPLPDPDPDVLSRWTGLFFVFPNFFILPQFGNALVYRCRPDSDDPEHCYFELWSTTLYPEGREPGKPEFGGVHSPYDADAWPLIPFQDFSNIERQQKGLRTPGYRAHRLSSEFEHGISNMHRELDAYLAR